MSQHLSTHNISSKSMHTFLSNLAFCLSVCLLEQTDRQTDKQTQAKTCTSSSVGGKLNYTYFYSTSEMLGKGV